LNFVQYKIKVLVVTVSPIWLHKAIFD
jgi:hypothetical protein